MRWLAAIAVVGSMLAVAATASAQAPTQDSVTGTIRSPFFVEVVFDAHSGPNGESPSGTVDFNGFGDFNFDGPVNCLNVRGNVATFNIDTIYGPFPAEVTDNAASGAPDAIRGGGVSRDRGDCSPFTVSEGLIRESATSGDLRIVDAQPPSVNNVSPANGATNVPREALIVAGFSQVMNKATAQGAFVLRRTSNGVAVAGTFGWYGTALLFAPSAPLAPGVGYTASINTSAVNLAGYRMRLPKIWQFTASNDTTAPQIYGLSPADGATGVGSNTLVVAAFSEAMNKSATQVAFSLRRTSTGAAVTGTFGWYGPAGLIFQPSSALVRGAEYSATLSTAAKDLSGNHLAQRVWRFRVQP